MRRWFALVLACALATLLFPTTATARPGAGRDEHGLWPGPVEPPLPSRTPANRLSFGLLLDSTALHAKHGTEWRVGGALEIGTPGPAAHRELWTGWVFRGLVGDGFTRVAGRHGGLAWTGARVGRAWVGEIRGADTAFVISTTVSPVLSLVGGAKRLSLALQPGVMFRFHTFGLAVSSPLEVGIYSWQRGPWGAGSLGQLAVGIQVAAGIWIPGVRW